MPDVTFPNRYTGDLEPLTIVATYDGGDNDGEAIAVSSATAVIIDPDRDEDGELLTKSTVSATADAAGTRTSFVSTDIAGLGDDFLNGVPCRVKKSDGRLAITYITDYVSTSGSLTLEGLPWAVASGDSLTVMGYPVQVQAAASVGGTGSNEVTCNAGASAFDYVGKRVVIFYVTFSSSWKEVVRGLITVSER